MKKLLGIVFLLAAATVVYFGSVGWPSLDVNLWSLIPVGLFLFFTLENLLKKDYKASLMCFIIVFIIANAILDLLSISSGLVIGAGVLTCVVLVTSFLIKKIGIDEKIDKEKTLQSLYFCLIEVFSISFFYFWAINSTIISIYMTRVNKNPARQKNLMNLG